MSDTTKGIRLEVKVRTTPRHLVISEIGTVTTDTLHDFIATAMKHLAKVARPIDSPYVVYLSQVAPGRPGEVEVCQPVATSSQLARPTRPEEPQQFAYTRIVKGIARYPQIMHAYDAVEAWAIANRRELVGPGREIYFADWDRVRDDDLAVDVGFPIR